MASQEPKARKRFNNVHIVSHSGAPARLVVSRLRRLRLPSALGAARDEPELTTRMSEMGLIWFGDASGTRLDLLADGHTSVIAHYEPMQRRRKCSVGLGVQGAKNGISEDLGNPPNRHPLQYICSHLQDVARPFRCEQVRNTVHP
jgi:hypothetical protein